MNRWFRFYEGVLDDPKVQRLDPSMFKAWVNLLCLASRNGGRFPAEDVSFCLRVTVDEALRVTEMLSQAGLIEAQDGFFKPHNWDCRQYKSDASDPTNALRQKRYRDRHRNGESNGVTTVTVTATRADTEQSRDRARSKRASRIPDDWKPSEEEVEFAKKEGLSEFDVQRQAKRFLDFWKAKPGAGGTKLDWPATWRNWIRSEAEKKRGGPSNDEKYYGVGRIPGIV